MAAVCASRAALRLVTEQGTLHWISLTRPKRRQIPTVDGLAATRGSSQRIEPAESRNRGASTDARRQLHITARQCA